MKPDFDPSRPAVPIAYPRLLVEILNDWGTDRETLLAGTGGCTAYDVVLILKRGRHDVRGCSVKLSSERAETEPKVFTKLHLHYIVTGNQLKREAVERAITLSKDKYCSATAMLGATAEITWDLDLRDAAAA
jgi:putative redox protein